MQLGIVGLGRMGGNMARRLMKGGHEIVGYAADPAGVKEIGREGGTGTTTLDDFVRALRPPRVAWVMVPAGAATEQVVTDLAKRMAPGDTIVDGGNSFYKDDVRRMKMLRPQQIHYVDVGTSGGVWGLERGYCLMIGGERDVVERLAPIFTTLSPGTGSIPRTPGRETMRGTAEHGYLYCGPSGAGHFVKMIHNGIEYGLMQAYAEGLDILKNASAKTLDPDLRYDLNIADVTEVWRRGSVVSSWLLDLTAQALAENPTLSNYEGVVADSGEGRWTVMAAVEEGVPADVLSASLYARFRSRQDHTFAEKVLSAMRQKFGGHVEQKSGVILAGDVGGTKTALALFDVRRRGVTVVREGVLPSQGYAALQDAIRQFLLEGPRASIDAACVGVAGPVIDGRCAATNLPWVVDEASLAACLSTTRVKLINDLEATGHGVLGLKRASLATLQAGQLRKGRMALIAAGTGLGEVLLVWDGRRHHVVSSEGGHADFAPRTDLEIDLFRFLRKEFGRVSYERVVSGPGLYNIYRFLLSIGGAPEADWLHSRMETGDPSAVIAEAALDHRDPRAVQALDMFVSIYGAEAGNLALKALAVEGVLIGGGIAPKIRPKLEDGTFMSAFRDKGRLSGMMAAIPVHLVLEPRAALLGAAAVARSLLSGPAPRPRAHGTP